MTARQEKQVTHMRLMGESYVKISKSLSLPYSTIKSFCQRRNLGGRKNASKEKQKGTVFCACCGKEVPQTEHRKLKRFCSDACRMAWWKEHRHLISRKSVVTFRCAYCGKEFTDYSSTGRKFCCHECYIAYRFGGVGDEQRPVS